MAKPGFKRGIAYALKKGAYAPQLAHIGRGRPYPLVPDKLKIKFSKAGKRIRLTAKQKEFLAKCRNWEYDITTKVEHVGPTTVECLEPNSVRGSVMAGKKVDNERSPLGTGIDIESRSQWDSGYEKFISTR